MLYTTFGILFASALLDVILFFTVGNLVQCYRCHCEYRGSENVEQHPHFSLETHEKFRQQAARMKEAEAAQQASNPPTDADIETSTPKT